jgi:hypothetical protein
MANHGALVADYVSQSVGSMPCMTPASTMYLDLQACLGAQAAQPDLTLRNVDCVQDPTSGTLQILLSLVQCKNYNYG